MKLKKGSLEAKRFMAKIRAKKGKSKKVSGVKKPSVKKTHTDIKSHNYKISISGNKKKFNKEILDFLNKEGKKSKGFTYRAKVLWGQEIVLKEKNGVPIQKFVFNDFQLCVDISKELNKGQKYTKIK